MTFSDLSLPGEIIHVFSPHPDDMIRSWWSLSQNDLQPSRHLCWWGVVNSVGGGDSSRAFQVIFVPNVHSAPRHCLGSRQIAPAFPITDRNKWGKKIEPGLCVVTVTYRSSLGSLQSLITPTALQMFSKYSTRKFHCKLLSRLLAKTCPDDSERWYL